MTQTSPAVKDLLKRIDALSDSLDASQLLGEKENESNSMALSETLRQNPSQIILLNAALSKLQVSLDKVNSQQESLFQTINSSPMILCEQNQGLLSKVNKKSPSLEEKKSPKTKKFKKKVGKKNMITHMEIHKGYLSSLLEIMNSQQFRIDHNTYRKLIINTFDFLPYVSQKISHYATSKEVYIEILSLIWKLITFPQSSVTFSDQQKLVGQPDLFPVRYGQEGPLYRLDKKFNLKKVVIKKGAFSFFEDLVHSEVTRICRKIYTNSTKHLVMLANSGNGKEEKKDEFGDPNIRELLKEIKENMMSKIFLYKVNYLSFLISCYLETPKFEPTLMKARDIKVDYFERSIQADHIKLWESQILNNLI